MLVAYNDSGQRKVASELVKSLNFVCPECSQEVIVRAGGKRVAHFAHLVGKACNAEQNKAQRKKEAALRKIMLAQKENEILGQKSIFDFI